MNSVLRFHFVQQPPKQNKKASQPVKEKEQSGNHRKETVSLKLLYLQKPWGKDNCEQQLGLFNCHFLWG